MNPKESRIALFVALSGVAICISALAWFMFVISDNRLDLSADQPVRDHYVAVGHFYGQGFIVGFFLCLCLAVTAVALSSWIEHRRAERGQDPVRGVRHHVVNAVSRFSAGPESRKSD